MVSAFSLRRTAAFYAIDCALTYVLPSITDFGKIQIHYAMAILKVGTSYYPGKAGLATLPVDIFAALTQLRGHDERST